MRALNDVESRLRLLPPIRRARLWRLYAENGRRFLDLWAEGGRRILGAKGTGIGTTLKASIDQGLLTAFPSVWERRLAKSILARWPLWREIRLYASCESAFAALQRAGSSPAQVETAAKHIRASLLRPFDSYLQAADCPDGMVQPDLAASSIPPKNEKPTIGIPVLPLASSISPGVLLFSDKEASAGFDGELVPAFRLAAAARSLSEFDRFCAGYNEGLWSRVDRRLSAFFLRSGPWLKPRWLPSAHDEVFRAALGGGILLPPKIGQAALIPGDFDDGEIAALEKALLPFANGIPD